jgi:hypothetical protein
LETAPGGEIFVNDGAEMVVQNGGDLIASAGLGVSGTFTLDTGGFVSVPGTMSAFGGTFDFLGGTLQAKIFSGPLNNQGGTLAPGPSTGNMLIERYIQSSGAMQFEIGGQGQGTQFDFINVLQFATFINGRLELKLVNGFVPGSSETFVILSAASILGVLDNSGNGQRVATSDGFGSFLVHYGPGSPFNPNHIVLSAFLPTLPADFDLDGDVDVHDLTQWEGDFGVNDLSDADNDGDSDGADFLAWQQQLGSVPTAAGAVPEPAASTLVALALLGGALGRRRS